MRSVSEKPSEDALGLEEDAPKIEASAEIEEALREASEAMDVRHKAAVAAGDATSPDKLTIEMLSSELQDLKNLHEEKLGEAQEQNERLVRLQAEFENFRRRGLKEKQESFKFGHQNIVKDLLSAVDNLERALEHGAQNADAEVTGILDGVELVCREILGTFAKHGIREIEAAGEAFDPALHEAMGQIPNSEVPPNTILQVLQKGYVIHDRMLRPARVIVSREATASDVVAGGQSAGDDSA